ncbi:FHA domain-containing protein [Streptomyces sp. URMC 126]|uniref:FHA domain-containing protein n=1 Tax=Streptomyces sp. URMC 126 TaxID=3423401 RepID=UPI003F1A9B70
MPTCPNGHQSVADDWCEVCGHRMTGVSAPTGAVPPPPAPPSYPGGTAEATMQAELCPQCRTPREAQAPFCEECAYNFLTGTASPYVTPPQPHGFQSAPPPPPQPTPPHTFDYHGSRPSRINRPAEPLTPQHTSPGLDGDGDWMLPPPAPAPDNPYAYDPGPPAAAPAPAGWIAVIAPDRDYFRSMMNRSGPEAAGLNLPAYSPEQQCRLTGPQVTIGRRRHSTGESPDIDLSRPPEDPGVSHQHAVLVEQPDGSWAVVDQDSTNGTTINGSEDPIQPYVPVPLHDGDRVHVGAWTTITVRRG